MGKMGKKQVLCILLGIILAAAGYLVEKRDGALEDGNRLNRYAYGEGERQQEVWVRGLCEKEIPVEISLGEREYAEEDAKKALLEAGGKLADLIRGNNLSLQEVREDLHLVGWLEEEGIRVRWTPEDAEWIQTDGTVLNEECPEKGIQTELTASLQAGVFSREYRFPVTLYPPLRTKQQEKEAGFKRLLKQMDEAQRTEGQLVLPKMYEGKNLSYRVRGDREYLLFPVLGIAAAILLPLYEKQKESEAKKKKKRELMEDYPEIVSKLTVFSGAGLPVRPGMGADCAGIRGGMPGGNTDGAGGIPGNGSGISPDAARCPGTTGICGIWCGLPPETVPEAFRAFGAECQKWGRRTSKGAGDRDGVGV